MLTDIYANIYCSGNSLSCHCVARKVNGSMISVPSKGVTVKVPGSGGPFTTILTEASVLYPPTEIPAVK